MSVMGSCAACGARCMTASGPTPQVSRAEAVAAVLATGRRLGYVFETLVTAFLDVKRLICRECFTGILDAASPEPS